MRPWGFVFAVVTVLAASLVATSWSRRQRALRRLHDDEAQTGALSYEASDTDTMLGTWLSQAGFRRPDAVSLFIGATLGCALLGLVGAQLYRVTVQTMLVAQVTVIPGGAGEVLGIVLQRGGWILFVLITLLPMSTVRAARRARVRAIEQDLPLALEMLATMAEAGLGFDAALTNIVRARGAQRPLMAEFTKFQLDMIAGMPRSQALRQLARRVHVPALTSFTSSLVQAERVGASIAETLQHQATDLRQRRREEALLHAQALPVKLVFPLVICFLPGVFLSTLAPALYQMVQVANSVLRSGQ
ncbi:MAG: type II secretion system F family protein [Acidobacteriota bacterium]